METAQWLFRVTRPVQFLAAACGAWAVAVLSNGPDPFTSNKLAAAVTMGLFVCGASVYHYGAAHRMYARKLWDLIEVRRPEILVVAGFATFAAAIGVAWCYLPWSCIALILFDVVAISLYAQYLCKRWVTKNAVIAIVCTTPVLIGWWAGSHGHEIIPYGTAIVFTAYFAREIIKDVMDIKANEGIRVTLPMLLGTQGALKVAGSLALASTAITVFMLSELKLPMVTTVGVTVTVLALGRATAEMFFREIPQRAQKDITVGIWALIVSMLWLGLH